ncbi:MULTISPECIES: chloride channel protein [Rhodanobacter]|uniref:chloride channel protein n=1 Tax=Rhodanobacter TaxID=75309 RepID=UPI00041ACA4A|nr:MULTISPECIES: chloride channel protein [Rhodanobacter]TAN18314.1 MAG: chloride channel protein [Rhodanobacter sp.]UJJ53921.1 chloride channel protein [Rhodanobacter thiooxydans]
MRRFCLTEPLVMLVTVLQWLVLAIFTGALVGAGCTLFLRALFATEGHAYAAPWWVLALALPLGGLANGLLLHYGYRLRRSTFSDNVIVAVNEQHGKLPFRTMWIKPVCALITLACGGSAGKEGPCSHIGASLAAAVGRMLHLNPEMRKRLLACGVSAGFSSVFGTPIAGAIYGVEMLAIGRIRHDFLFPAIVGGVTSFEVSRWLGVPYPHYVIDFSGQFTELLFLKTVLIGVLCGGVAWLFVELLGQARKLFGGLKQRWALWPPLVPMLGGVVLALLILLVPTDYLGLSLPLMERALHGEAMPWLGFVWKALLVAITLGSGFYGGIVTPQFVLGAVAGGAFAHLFGLTPALGAAVGLTAVVAAASNAPIAAILMGVELYGADATLYVAGACVAAYLIIGHRSVYPEQQIAFSKSSWIFARADLPVGQEKVRLSYGLLRWWRMRRRSRKSGSGE